MRSIPRPSASERAVPGPGQESVWDYPRPPRVEAVPERLRVVVDGEVVAETTRGFRVLETAGAPVYYIPEADIRHGPPRREHRTARSASGRGWRATTPMPGRIVGSRRSPGPIPTRPPGYEAIAGCLAFYAGRVDEAWVGDERATPQPGGFYGGWVTSRIVGPIKGGPGTGGW